jgi:hypothetical protein
VKIVQPPIKCCTAKFILLATVIVPAIPIPLTPLIPTAAIDCRLYLVLFPQDDGISLTALDARGVNVTRLRFGIHACLPAAKSRSDHDSGFCVTPSFDHLVRHNHNWRYANAAYVNPCRAATQLT